MALLAVLLACPVAAIAVEGDTDTQPGTVQGFTPGGTTINLFDYWITRQDDDDSVDWVVEHENQGINKEHTLNFGKGMSGGAGKANEWTKSAAPRTGLVANKLYGDGYPVLAVGNNESLAYLFNLDSFDGKQAYSNVGNLLQVDNTGYFYYDCKANFAEFDAEDNAFTLYDSGAVNAYGSSPDGQFFPFNTYNQVAGENIDSVNEVIKHYFGMTMRTRFVQQNGGYTTPDKDQAQAVTYNFSGDDDIWIFIDGVLVGDLGGIHNATSIEIDFSTGMVYVYEDKAEGERPLNNEYDDGETVYNGGGQGETLKSIFERVLGKDSIPDGLFRGDTFADNTYHTLDFFYLERGNTDSNMALKYNLVNIPETDIVKVDQDGEPVAGAVFDLYATDAYEQNPENAVPLAHAVTEADGSVVLLDPNHTNRPITLENLWMSAMGETSGENTCDLMMVETDVPAGHRVARKIPLQILKENKTADDPFYLLLSEDPWTTGAYAMPKVMLTAPEEANIEIETIPGSSATWSKTLKAGDIQNGLLFTIVEKKVESADGTVTWCPVYGDPLAGWTVADGLNADTVIAAAKATHAQFALDTTGLFRAEVNSLPGDILDYSFFAGEEEAEYRGAYFYSEAKTFDGITKDNTAIVTNPEAFTRNFSARVYVSNIINRFAVQKLDEKGSPVEDATMALYTNDQVTVDKNGVATPNENAKPQIAKTKKLTKENAAIDLEGACIFTNLDPGVYWVGEQASPKEPSDADPNGYLKNNTLAKVLVTDDGVFAGAGKAGDGVTVMRGVGRLMRSMVQFAVEDDIDVTLHNIVAHARKGKIDTTGEGDDAVTTVTWDDPDPIPGSEIHLQYAGSGEGVLDYKTDKNLSGDELQNVSEYYTVDEGVPGLVVNQCAEHKVEGEAAWTPLVEDDNTPIDITPLFTGVNVVRIANQRVSGLDVTKKVTADDPTAVGSNDEFTFTVRFTNPVGADGLATPLTQEQAEAVDMGVVAFETAPTGSMATRPVKLESDGSVKVTIKANETARFVNVPVGTTYTVIEEPCDGYVLSDKSEDMTGTIAFSDQRAVATAVVKNIKVDGATAAIDVQKTVTGTETADDFTFTIALSSETGEGIRDGVSVVRDGQLEPIGTESVTINPVTVTADFAEGHQTQRASSEQLVFTEEGTYIFDVKETVANTPPNWAYDTSSRKVTVNVKQGSETDTQLTAEVTYDNSSAPQAGDQSVEDASAFTNVYTAPTTTAQIEAIKRLAGDPATLLADQFTFELRDKDGKLVATAKNDAAGNVSFNPITYGTVGTYSYTLREICPETDDDAATPGIQQDGFTYDETVYRVSVSVDASEQGGLTAVVTYNEGADGTTGDAVKTPVFENTYTKQGGDPIIPDEPDPDTPDPDTPDPDDPDPDTPDPDTPDTPDTPEPDTPDTPDKPDTDEPEDKIPGTGDAMPAMVAGVAALGAVCIAGAVVLKKRSE